jgi:hypothetical protein
VLLPLSECYSDGRVSFSGLLSLIKICNLWRLQILSQFVTFPLPRFPFNTLWDFFTKMINTLLHINDIHIKILHQNILTQITQETHTLLCRAWIHRSYMFILFNNIFVSFLSLLSVYEGMINSQKKHKFNMCFFLHWI